MNTMNNETFFSCNFIFYKLHYFLNRNTNTHENGYEELMKCNGFTYTGMDMSTSTQELYANSHQNMMNKEIMLEADDCLLSTLP